MTKRLLTFAASSALAFSLCAPIVRADDKPSAIDLLAPENSVLVVGAKNLAASMDSLKATRLWDLWQSEHGQKMRDKFDEGMKDMLKEMSDDLEMELEELPMPTGAAGFAWFTVTDDDTGADKPGILVYADFGDQADKAYEIIAKIMEKGEEEGRLRTETINMVDREGWHAEFVVEEEPANDNADEEEDWDFEPAPSGPPFKSLEVIKEGTMLMISSDKDAMEQALHARDGEDINSVADRDDHRAIRTQLGEGEIYGELLMRDFWQAMGAAQGNGGGMMMMVAPMLEQYIGKIDGLGWTVKVGGQLSMVEQTWFVYMPQGKSGLTSLVGDATNRPKMPSFVSPETSTYVTVNLNMQAVGPLVRNVLRNPMLGGGMDVQMMEDIEKRVTDICNTLGSHMHVASRIKRPLAADSSRMVFAMECTKPQEFENLIANEAPQMGLESRDFLGQRIFSSPGEGMESFSIGIGGGFVIAGPSPEVEIALRAVNEKDAVTLEGDMHFKRALEALGAEDGVTWAYSDLVESIETNMRLQAMSAMESAEQMREFAPEYADEMIEEAKKLQAELDEFPSVEVLRQYIGPAAWSVRSIDEGFLGKSYILPGRSE